MSGQGLGWRRIVVAIDGTPAGDDAAALAQAIASQTGALVLLAGVFAPALLPARGVSDRRTLRAQVESWLRRARDAHAPGALLHTIAGDSVARALRHHAEEWHADLIILGSCRDTEPGHARLGRLGRQLVQDSSLAVAIAARGYADDARPLRAITVGWDTGRESDSALTAAERLAAVTGGTLRLHIVVRDGLPRTLVRSELTRSVWDELCESDRREAREAAEARAASLGVPASVSATVGDPGQLLRSDAGESDLMVIGSRRWGLLARVVSGATGESLASDCPCSLVIVPETRADTYFSPAPGWADADGTDSANRKAPPHAHGSAL